MLDDLLAVGVTDEVIAQRLRRTAESVRATRKRRGFYSRQRRLLSARATAQLLGKPCSKAVGHWIKVGALKAHAGQRFGRYRQWYVNEDDLLSFLCNPDYWPAWRPEDITEAGLREWALEKRNGDRLLSTREVAQRLGFAPHTVYGWVNAGVLPAVRYGNWWIRQSVLDVFVPPCNRERIRR